MFDRFTIYYVSGVFLLLCASAFLISGVDGVLLALLGTGVAYLFAPRISPYLVAKLKGARVISPYDNPELHRLLHGIVAKTDLGVVPTLMLFPSRLTNAYAVGNREQSVIALSTKCLQSLSHDEVAAIIAHEVGHIVNGDSKLFVFGELGRVATGVVAMLGTVMVVYIALSGYAEHIPTWIPIFFAAAPWVALWLQSRLSKRREILADAFSAKVLGGPGPMLRVIKRLYAEQQWAQYWGLVKLPGGLAKWFGTHPSLEERFEALKSIPDYSRPLRALYPRPIHIKYL